MTIANFTRLLLALGVAAGCTLASRSLIHLFQLESYQFPGYRRSVLRAWRRSVAPGLMMTVLAVALLAAHRTLDMHAAEGVRIFLALAVLALMTLGGGWCARLYQDKQAKKPLVITPRVKRLYGVMGVVYALLCLAIDRTGWPYALCLFPPFLPLWTALAGLIAWPLEKLISEMYFRDAQRKLRERTDLIKIGITGSYGKTSVKFILGTLLQEKYQTLVTPASFNTPMGVTRVIRERLRPAHQVFVAEMGARHVGDIREMCRLVHPTLGVLTSVGPQHLDTFKTLERIKQTKYELMDAIPQDGCCFFPEDGGICAELYARTAKPKRRVAIGDATADVWAEKITVSPQGSHFVLHAGKDSVSCTTRLLGAHNIQNILLAASVCLELHMTLAQVARGIGKLEPVEHRLQLIPSAGGTTVIDDAFNSNPRGAEAALNVLKDFPGRRIIVTPGMVELGSEEAEYNRQLGRFMADKTDLAILVGKKHTRPIAEGLREAGFPEEKIYPVGSLREATEKLGALGLPGDVVLFENDLPDNYSEE